MSSSFRRAPRPKLSSDFNSNPSSGPATVLKRRGTKAWTGGLTLTSCGLRELDGICGGGQPLGTAILVEEDRWTMDLALALARYWAAEGVSQKHNVLLVATASDTYENASDFSHLDADDFTTINNQSATGSSLPCQQGLSPLDLDAFIHILPRNLHTDKISKKSEQRQLSNNSNDNMSNEKRYISTGSTSLSGIQDTFAIIEEDEDFDENDDNNLIHDRDNDDEEKADAGLLNAWQYKISIQRQRFGQATPKTNTSATSRNSSDNVYCHSYDLSGRMLDQQTLTTSKTTTVATTAANTNNYRYYIETIDCKCATSPKDICSQSKLCASNLFKTCLLHIQTKLKSSPDGVVRLLLLNAPTSTAAIAISLLLSYIRQHSLPVVIMVTVRPWLLPISVLNSSSSLQALRRTCDAVFACEGFDAITSLPPPEFSNLAGIFTIRKMALHALSHYCDASSMRGTGGGGGGGGSGSNTAMGGDMTVSSSSSSSYHHGMVTNRYGMKRDRRKLHIHMLHLPPEDFSAGGSSVGGSGVRSGAGMKQEQTKHHGGASAGENGRTALQPGLSCASNLRQSPSNSNPLDF